MAHQRGGQLARPQVHGRSCLPNLRLGGGDEIPLEQFDVPFSPEIKAMLNAEYDFELANGYRLTLQGNLNYQDEAETDVFNGVNTQMEERTLLDASVTYHDPKDRWWIRPVGREPVGRDVPHRGAAGRGPVELHELRAAAFLRHHHSHEVRRLTLTSDRRCKGPPRGRPFSLVGPSTAARDRAY